MTTPNDLAIDIPINHAACAYRDYRAGTVTRDAAMLILKHNLLLPADAAASVLDSDPRSDDLPRALCLRGGWDHHDQTDDYPCTRCEADAGVLSAAAEES